MATLPILLNLVDEIERDIYSPSFLGHDFGYGLVPHHIQRHGGHHRHQPLKQLELALLDRLGVDGGSALARRRNLDSETGAVSALGKDGFQVCMDVAHFKPNELSVKVIDKHIVVEGKHEERADNHGHITRHFVRRYAIPENYDEDKVVSSLSSDGVLTVSLPKPVATEAKSNERVVQIQQVGPAYLNVKANVQEKAAGDANGDAENQK